MFGKPRKVRRRPGSAGTATPRTPRDDEVGDDLVREFRELARQVMENQRLLDALREDPRYANAPRVPLPKKADRLDEDFADGYLDPADCAWLEDGQLLLEIDGELTPAPPLALTADGELSDLGEDDRAFLRDLAARRRRGPTSRRRRGRELEIPWGRGCLLDSPRGRGRGGAAGASWIVRGDGVAAAPRP